MPRTRWWMIVLVLLLVGAGTWYSTASRGPRPTPVDVAAVERRSRFQATVSASGEIVATRYADIGSSVMGKIVRLAVTEGQRVSAGQLLARIDPVPAQSDASAADALVRSLEADELAASEQVKVVDAEVVAADARARDAGQQLRRKRELREAELVAASDFDAASAAAEAADAQLASARAAADRARRALEAASRRVAQARAQAARATDALSKTAIVSPIEGVVSRLRVREGEMVVVGIQNQPGTTLMTISDLSALNAEVKVAEADVLRLALGQPATVSLDAVPGKQFSGVVTEIGASALPLTGSGAAAREFRVVVMLERPDPSLRPGLTCDTEIVTSDRHGVTTVPLQSVVLRAPGPQSPERSGVFVVAEGRARFTPVESGIIGGLSIEVGGVEPGTSIVVGPYQTVRELQDGALVRVNEEPATR